MKKEPFKIAVNGQYQFEVHPDEAKDLNVILNDGRVYHILENGQGYRVELLEADYANRTYTFRIDGTKLTVGISDYYERLIQELGLHTGAGHKVNSVKAPMPGLVIKVMVEPGQTVEKGDPLLVLEAMKMENVIKAAGEGVVKNVHAHNGQAVDKGFTLLEFE